MNLQDCLNKVLSEWPNETQTKFTDNQLANFIRKDFAHTVQTIVHKSDSDLIIKASAGAGNWADVPWLSILNPRITKTTQDGIYPVFLFRSDGTGAYLSLGQGITIPKERLGKNRAEERSAWIIDYLRQQIPILHQWDKGKLELHANTPLGKSYGTANIGSHFYERSSLPSNKILESDLIELLSIYDQAVSLWPNISDDPSFDPPKSKLRLPDFNVTTFVTSLIDANISLPQTLPCRFVSALLTKPFVILTGLSGSGKTKLAEAFSLWISEDKNQYCMVSVGADWTNREPILGYPNALEPGKYVKPDSGALDLILNAKQDSERPYFLILDEMNMSHVERYFADFLSAMESTDRTISLHPEGDEWNGCDVPATVELPKNLFVIGTVNIDETTYMFSPKVLDRANVIEFRVSEAEMQLFFEDPAPLNMEALRGKGAAMGVDFVAKATASVKPKSDLEETLMPFFRELHKAGAEYGYRTAYEISRFAVFYEEMAADLKDPEDETRALLNGDAVVDAAVMQKLLPKVHGSRNRIEPILRLLAKLCMTDQEMEPFTENTAPGDIRYPLSYEKLQRMHRRIMSDGFTSYAEA